MNLQGVYNWASRVLTTHDHKIAELEAQVKRLRELIGGNDLSGHSTASLGWVCTVVVSPAGQNTVNWTAGTITLTDGQSLSIASGTYTLVAPEYHVILYVEWGNHTLQPTQTIANAIGQNKIPIAMADSLNADASDYASVINFKGTAFADQIALNQNAVRTAKILNSNVTYAKIQNVTDDRLLGNSSGSSAAPSEISYGTTPSTQAFGDSASAGSTKQPERAGHKHAMPADPVTAHVGESDPHTQYLKEEASGGAASEIPDHTHADTSQAGTVAHSALTGVTSDQHHAQSHTLHSHTDGKLILPDSSTLTIVESLGIGVIVVTDAFHYVDSEGGAGTDNLDTISLDSGTGEGMIIVLALEDASHIITVKHNTGNIQLANGKDFVFANYKDRLVLMRDVANNYWTEIARKKDDIGLVTNGDDHDHSGGDGAQIAHSSLSGATHWTTGNYSGDGTGEEAIAHSLGRTPKMVIVYCDDWGGSDSIVVRGDSINGTTWWAMQHTSTGGVTVLDDNLISGVTVWDSTNFSVPSQLNATSYEYYWIAMG